MDCPGTPSHVALTIEVESPMPAYARSQIVDENQVGYYHCISSCVRRASLCGEDPQTRSNYDHRRDWLLDRIQFVSSEMSVDVVAFALMSNHYHIVLKNRPDKAQKLEGFTIGSKWVSLCSNTRPRDFTETQKAKATAISRNRALRASVRRRLSSISWFMKFVNEYIAKLANKEERSSAPLGRFWNGRFKSIRLMDSMALLACAAYVDLNLVNAGLAKSVEKSRWTSFAERHQRSANRNWISEIEDEIREFSGDFNAPRSTSRAAATLSTRPRNLNEYGQYLHRLASGTDSLVSDCKSPHSKQKLPTPRPGSSSLHLEFASNRRFFGNFAGRRESLRQVAKSLRKKRVTPVRYSLPEL